MFSKCLINAIDVDPFEDTNSQLLAVELLTFMLSYPLDKLIKPPISYPSAIKSDILQFFISIVLVFVSSYASDIIPANHFVCALIFLTVHESTIKSASLATEIIPPVLL